MKKKKALPLIKTNPYLRDPSECDAWLNRAVVSSSAIEGAQTAARRALGIETKVTKIGVGRVPPKSSRSRH